MKKHPSLFETGEEIDVMFWWWSRALLSPRNPRSHHQSFNCKHIEIEGLGHTILYREVNKRFVVSAGDATGLVVEESAPGPAWPTPGSDKMADRLNHCNLLCSTSVVVIYIQIKSQVVTQYDLSKGEQICF